MTQEPAFIFTFLYLRWYDPDKKEHVRYTYDYPEKGWFDDQGVVLKDNIVTLEKDTEVEVMWSIKNSGYESGLPVFKLVDASLIARVGGGDVLLRVQKSSELGMGRIWSEQSNFKYSGKKRQLEFFACAYIDGRDYVRDTLGPPYLQLWPKP